jgi:hypothetical protein
LGKAITTLSNFEVYPAIAVATSEGVFLDKLIRDVRELDANIFGIGHGSIKVEVLKVNGAEPSALPGEDTVEEEFDEFKGCGVGANVARIANPVSADGDTGSVRIILLWADFTDHHGMTDLLALVEGDVLEVDEKEGVGTSYPLFGWRSTRANALAEPPEFVSVGGIPNSLVAGVPTKLAMFKEFTCSRIQDREGRRVTAIQGLKRRTKVCKSINLFGSQ